MARLYREQGRGHRCSIDPYERGGRLYLFLYIDDYTQTHIGHNDRGKPWVVELRPDAPVPAGITLLYLAGDACWDRLAPDARLDRPHLFAPASTGPSRPRPN